MSRYLPLPVLIFGIWLQGCNVPETPGPDTIFHHGDILTMDSIQPRVSALAVEDGKIVAIGGNEEVLALAGSNTRRIDLRGRFAMPGLIEGHAHFYGLGESLYKVSLMDTRSWNEVIDSVTTRLKDLEKGAWLEGRGWHQEKWLGRNEELVEGYPTNLTLSERTPDNPVILKHASGHALMANKAALAAAGIDRNTPDTAGGRIIRDRRGDPTGILEENAMEAVEKALADRRRSLPKTERMEEDRKVLLLAQQHCLASGITSFQDAGSGRDLLELLRDMAAEGNLGIRLWAMLIEPADELAEAARDMPWIDRERGLLTVRAIKAYLDGALGSHGAWLLKPYNDKPGFLGQQVSRVSALERTARLARDKGMQFCVHAIGDRANRECLGLFERILPKSNEKAPLRWRIEHAQHLDSSDLIRFRNLGVIASMQPVHCISDAPFVEKRLGADRARLGAYVWRDLLDRGAPFAVGTDAPVEAVDPFANMHAAVTRLRPDNGEPFHPEQCMTRMEVIHAYTLGNAWAAFEEAEKGSLTPGKWADLIVLDQDITACSDEQLRRTKVLTTYLGGKEVWRRP